MIRVSRYRFGVIRALLLAALFAIVLVASTAVAALAGTGAFNKTASMNVASIGHTATPLASAAVETVNSGAEKISLANIMVISNVAITPTTPGN